ncbi:hypothetical protein CAPTEDRAFT_96254 [Capitella teleta]|uniref:alpha-L-fucosidase n=1 Tax=Capitella teleta TaxID=283909 RepID=R7VF74_CAPTE|nr:hypothetical protein CAPTEDRAFT_96254 [Capitella teleta]|eukprot:ELU14961.1 hypothetical protein CAPTEDRAFT_96254 [Capitella teleta]
MYGTYTVLLLIVLGIAPALTKRFTPDWDSLDSRTIPEWYDQGKVGIFITWGLYSVPAFQDEWFWWNWQGAKIPEYVKFMKDNYSPQFTYSDFAAQFGAELYDPNQWADIFKASGARSVNFYSNRIS